MGTAFGALAGSKEFHEKEAGYQLELLEDNFFAFEDAIKAKDAAKARRFALNVMIFYGMLQSSHAAVHGAKAEYRKSDAADRQKIMKYVRSAERYLLRS